MTPRHRQRMTVFALAFAAVGVCMAGAKEPVRTLKTALKLPTEDFQNNRTFEFSGQVLSDRDRYLLLDDGTARGFMDNIRYRQIMPQRGDLIRVSGVLTNNLYRENEFVATGIEIVGYREPPPPLDIGERSISRPELLMQSVRTRGVVTSVFADTFDGRYNWMTVKNASGVMNVSIQCQQESLERLRRLIDAEVELVGIVSPYFSLRRSLGVNLSLNQSQSIRVLREAPKDLFRAPRLTSAAKLHRQREEGCVLATTKKRYFLRTADGGLLPVRPRDGSELPQPGSSVTVVGFAEMDAYHLQLVEAEMRVRPEVAPALESPRPMVLGSFLSEADTNETECAVNHGKVLRLTGEVRYLPGEPEKFGTFELLSDNRVVSVDVSTAFPDFDQVVPSGSQIEVSGLFVFEFEDRNPVMAMPQFRSYTLIPRTKEDIRILERPSWWTPSRLGWLVGSLLVLVIGTGVWNFVLRTVSERRGRQLFREKIDHAKAEVKVEERTRLAIELHDAISQTLTGVAFQVDSAISANAGGNADIERHLELSRQLLSSCRQDLKGCLWDLRSRTYEEKDMTEAVLLTTRPYAGTAKIAARFNVPRRLFSETTVHVVLKIVRELVSNAVAHGKARNVSVAGEYREGVIRFSVRDDGSGFDPATSPGPVQGHFGLQGIRERLRKLHGTMTVDSVPGTGTRVVVTFEGGVQEETGNDQD